CDGPRRCAVGTHASPADTPVPAGIAMFPPAMMVKYFRSSFPSLKLDDEGFLALGREDVADRKQGFSMALLAIRLADHINGVSELHGKVSRRMWHNVWPRVPVTEVPIRHVTNGVHVRTWLSPDLAYTLDRYLPGEWMTEPADSSVWEGVMQIPEEELWRAHERGRARLVGWARQTLREQLI